MPISSVITGANTDGRVKCTGAAYSATLDGSGTYDSDTRTSSTTLTVGQNLVGGAYEGMQLFCEFDVSALPAVSSWTSVTFSMMKYLTDSSPSPILVKEYDWGGGTLATGDYRTQSQFNALPTVASLASGSYSSGTRYNFTSLSAFTGMNTYSGYVRLVLCNGEFASGTAPTGDNYTEWYSSNYSTQANRPTLTVSYVPTYTGTGAFSGTGYMESTPPAGSGAFYGTGSFSAVGIKQLSASGVTGAIRADLTLSATGSIINVPSSHSGIDLALELSMNKNGAQVRWDPDNPLSTLIEEQENKRCEVRLYEDDGKTFVAILDKARNVRWQDDLNDIGVASFEVPLSDSKTALIQQGMVVKFHWRGHERFGCILTKESTDICRDEQHNIWLKFEGQPGPAHIFNRAVVFPEWNLAPDGERIENSTSRGVITKTRNTDRWFGFMSWRGEWQIVEDWLPVSGIKFDTVADTIHSKYCPGWDKIDKNAYWIDLAPGPDELRTAGEVHYFRGAFTIASNIIANFWATADNMCTVYLDNELLFEEDRTSTVQWQTPKVKQVELLKGTHLIAARVENATVLEAVGPMALIVSLVKVSETTGAPGEYTLQTEFASSDLFESASTGFILTANGLSLLRTVCDDTRGTTPLFTVEVYSSSVGDAGENLTLTQQRALAVSNSIAAILAERGVTANVTYSGLGETNFKYSPDTSDRNHRVEIIYPPIVPGEGTATPGSSSIVFRTNETDNWTVTATSPGWFRAQIVKKMIEEAWNRGVYGYDVVSPSYLMSFNDYRDSTNIPWTNRGQWSFPIGTTKIIDILNELSENYFDWHWDAENWELDCWNRAGRDKCAEIRLFPGHSLLSFSTSSDSTENVTWMTTRLENGEWISRPDYGDIQPLKRIESGMSLGSSDAEATALKVISDILAENENPVISFEAEVSSNIGFLPYIDYDLGDTILVPGHRGEGVIPARILSITCDFSTEPPTMYPEMVIDRSSEYYEG